jgi:TP901 family phage tail tape measure protein
LGGLGLALGGAALIGGLVSVIGIFKDFEQANANLSAVLGKSKSEIIALSNDSKRLGASTAFTAAQVAGLQTEYAKLGFTQDEILKSTEATLSLAAATNTDLAQSATQVGAALRAFGLDASEAGRVADVFAASTSKSALDMEKLNTSMSIVAPVAKQFGFSIEDSTALLGSLANAGFDASSAATATRNIFLNMADANGKLAKSLGRPVTSLEDMLVGMEELRAKGVDLATMLDLTDKRSVAAFATFLDGTDSIRSLSVELKNAEGAAAAMAKTQLDTLGGSLTILESAYQGFILSMEDGTGGFASQLRMIVDVTAEMFTLASGMGAATETLTENQRTIRSWAEFMLSALKVVGTMIAVMLAWKAAILITKGALLAYNAIANAVFLVQMIKYTAATSGLTFAQAALAIAQAELNTIMAANPMMLMVIGIAALIALVVVAISYWDSFGAAIMFVGGIIAAFFSPVLAGFALLISVIMSVYNNWSRITEAFKSGGILQGLLMIGKVLLDAILNPLQQILDVVAKVTGFDWAANAAKGLESFRADMGVNVGAETPAINPEKSKQDALIERQESVQKQEASILVRSQPGVAELENNGGIPIRMDYTLDWQR